MPLASCRALVTPFNLSDLQWTKLNPLHQPQQPPPLLPVSISLPSPYHCMQGQQQRSPAPHLPATMLPALCSLELCLLVALVALQSCAYLRTGLNPVAPFPWGEGIRRLSPPGQEQGSAGFTPGSGLPVKTCRRGGEGEGRPLQGAASSRVTSQGKVK